MRVLICGINYAPDLIGVPKYNTELAESFAACGHDVRVVTAPPYYPDWTIPASHRSAWYATEFLNAVRLTRAPIYVPRRPTGTKRLLHHGSFALTSLFPLASEALRFRPDIVFSVAPSLLSAPGAVFAARLAGASAWLHIQDLEIDAAFELGLLRDERARKTMLAVERVILGGFDRVSTISPQMMRRVREKGVSPARVRELRNWADVTAIKPRDRKTSFRAALGLADTDIVALYSGAMSSKQGLDLIVDAATATAATHPHVHYVLGGNGPHKAELMQMAAGLRNVHFLDLQPIERLPDLLATADLHLMPQKAEAADLVLPSKLSGMLASGRPIIVMAAAGTGIAQETDGTGLAVAPGDSAALSAAVRTLADDGGLRASFGTAARLRAEQVWDRGAIIHSLEREFQALRRPVAHAVDRSVPEERPL